MKKKCAHKDEKPIQSNKISCPAEKWVHWVARIRPVVWLLLTVFAFSVFMIFFPERIGRMLWKGICAQKFVLSMLAALSLLALSLIWSTGQKIDTWAFLYLNEKGKRPPWLDWIMLGITQAGNGLFAYAAALVLFLCVQHLLAYELMFGTLTLWLAVELMKVLIRRPRPYSSLAGMRTVGRREGGHSFPSGHTSQAFYMASLLSHYYKSVYFLPLLLYTLALLVGITRIYIGMHYPRDVLGGIILGTAWGLVGVLINSYLFSHVLVLPA